MDFGSDSDGDDAFRWDLFEQTALIQRRVNELFHNGGDASPDSVHVHQAISPNPYS